MVNSRKLNYLRTALFPGDVQSGTVDLSLGKFGLHFSGSVPIAVAVSISKLLVFA